MFREEEIEHARDQMMMFISDHPEVLDEGRTWPQIRAMAEAAGFRFYSAASVSRGLVRWRLVVRGHDASDPNRITEEHAVISDRWDAVQVIAWWQAYNVGEVLDARSEGLYREGAKMNAKRFRERVEAAGREVAAVKRLVARYALALRRPGKTVVNDLASLSSGTIASLTGERSYEGIDRIQGSLVEAAVAAIERGELDPNAAWNVAWELLRARLGYAEQLTGIERNQLNVALKTLKMNPAMRGVMGGPSLEEAIAIVKRLAPETAQKMGLFREEASHFSERNAGIDSSLDLLHRLREGGHAAAARGLVRALRGEPGAAEALRYHADRLPLKMREEARKYAGANWSAFRDGWDAGYQALATGGLPGREMTARIAQSRRPAYSADDIAAWIQGYEDGYLDDRYRLGLMGG